MVRLINEIVITRSATADSGTDWSSEKCAHSIERSRHHRPANMRIVVTGTDTRVPSRGVRLESGFGGDSLGIADSSSGVRDAWEPWNILLAISRKLFHPIDRTTRATAATSTTVSHIASLLRRHDRDERIRRMPPENQAKYERIRRLREEIGSINFDVTGAIREARQNG